MSKSIGGKWDGKGYDDKDYDVYGGRKSWATSSSVAGAYGPRSSDGYGYGSGGYAPAKSGYSKDSSDSASMVCTSRSQS